MTLQGLPSPASEGMEPQRLLGGRQRLSICQQCLGWPLPEAGEGDDPAQLRCEQPW